MNPDPEDPCYWYQKEIAEQQKSLEIAYQYRAEQDAEIERLRAAREACEQQFQEKVARVNELDAENERLHLELERHQVTGDYEMGQLHANAALEAEIERLRALIDKHNDECRECPVIEAA